MRENLFSCYDRGYSIENGFCLLLFEREREREEKRVHMRTRTHKVAGGRWGGREKIPSSPPCPAQEARHRTGFHDPEITT